MLGGVKPPSAPATEKSSHILSLYVLVSKTDFELQHGQKKTPEGTQKWAKEKRMCGWWTNK